MSIDNQKMSIILPGRILQFDEVTQLATVLVCVDSLYSNALEQSLSVRRRPIEGVPVHTVSGGGWSITMPVEAGDTCTLYFSQVGYDHWLYNDQDTAGTLAGMPKPHLRRQFNEDDGFALVGFNTVPRAIGNFTKDGSQWRNKDASQSIHLKADKTIEIRTPATVVIDTPDTFIKGNLTVDGEVIGKMNIAAGANVTAGGGLSAGVPLVGTYTMVESGTISGHNIAITGDMATGAVSSYNGHVHLENGAGNDTGGPK